MRQLKFSIELFFSLALLFFFTSCKKDQSSVPDNGIRKDQLLGKWNMSVLLPGGSVEKDGVTLKADGTMDIDIEPQDGKADFILSWDIKNNAFTANWDNNGVSYVWFKAQVYPETLLITGEKMANGGMTFLFSMVKQ